MLGIKPRHVRSRVTLHIFCGESAAVGLRVNDIRSSEISYLKTRDPTLLNPIGLTEPASTYLKNRYGSPSHKHGTAWIDDLRTNHKLTSCPMCGGSGVTTLDHFLPKEVYPELSCFPYNIVPSCFHCNQKRGTKSAWTAYGCGFIHPYYDHAILAAVQITSTFKPPYEAVEYGWDIGGILAPEDFKRVKDHLDASINEMFHTEAMNANWRVWHARAQRLQDRNALLDRAQSDLGENAANGSNCWDAWFLRGILADPEVLDWMMHNPNN